MAKEELLCRNRAGRIDHDLLSGVMSFGNERGNIGKERSLDLSGLVSMLPQVTLKSFQIRGLDVPRHEIADMIFKSIAGVAILLGKRLPVLTEAGVVPLLVEDLGKRIECVGELATTCPKLVMAVGVGIDDDLPRASA